MRHFTILTRPLILLGTLCGSATLLCAAADLKAEAKAAAQKLADKPNYSWTAETKNEGGGGAGGGAGAGATWTGKTDKDGLTCVAIKGRNDQTIEVVRKGEKFVAKTAEGWQTAEELRQAAAGGGGGQGRGGFMVQRFRTMKCPAGEVEDLLTKVGELKKGDQDAIVGDLTEAGAKDLLSRGRRGGQGGQAPPAPEGAKGSIKLWLKDGALAKYEVHLQGKITVGQDQREMEVNRTTITEIKDVGTTKLEVPAEAKNKL